MEPCEGKNLEFLKFMESLPSASRNTPHGKSRIIYYSQNRAFVNTIPLAWSGLEVGRWFPVQKHPACCTGTPLKEGN